MIRGPRWDARRLGLAAGWAVSTGLVLFGTARLEPGPGERPIDVPAYLIVVLACAVPLATRRYPAAAAAVVSAALAGYLLAGYPDGPVLVTGLAVLYLVGAVWHRRAAYPVAAGMSGLLVSVNMLVDGGPGVIDLVFVGWGAAAVFAADAVRGRRERIAAARERARWRAETRVREERRRLAEERLRIARDLHDSVAHAMATVNVQSGMAARVIDSRPDLAREALEVIRETSGQVLDELNAMVRVLRAGDGRDAGDRRGPDDGRKVAVADPDASPSTFPDGVDPAPLRPAPDLDELPALVRASRRAGLAVALTVTGSSRAVAPPVSRAAYRIVQEALTNVTRHSAAGRAEVIVDCAEHGGLRVEVTDPGPPVPAARAGTGVGIVGMRERAAATGGTLVAEPRPGAGFTVRASWPRRRP